MRIAIQSLLILVRSSFLLLASVVACLGASIPVTHGTTLTGKETMFPRDLAPRYTVLILGFSQKSAEPSREWAKKVALLVESGEGLGAYLMPVLESAPRLVRALIVRGMKKGTSAAVQASFLPIFENEKDWKSSISFAAADDAYVLVVNRQGEIIWQTSGSRTEAKLDELSNQLGIEQ